MKNSKDEIKITPNGIKQAIDDLLNENELLQDKIYKLEEKIDKTIEYINSQSPDAGVSGKQIKNILKGESNEK